MTENQIVAAAQSGDRDAELQLIVKYGKLVHKLAWKYSHSIPSLTHEDLTQEGNIGLLKAIRTYDPTKGAKFLTWAYHQVRGAITACNRSSQRQVKYPLSLENCPRAYYVPDPTQNFEAKDDIPEDLAEMLIESCCGGFETRRAKVVIDRFGLFGQTELRNCETAAKYNTSKFAVNTHVYAFKKKAAEKFPFLEMYL